jgi:hypothetical protein
MAMTDSFEDVKQERFIPLLCEEGWPRHQQECREASFEGADGVVAHTETWFVSDHPVCGAKVAFAGFS